jgi:Fe-S cluster assembly iron-binding protein IscA
MLTVTDHAADVMRASIHAAGDKATGMRISAGDPITEDTGRHHFRIEAVYEADDNDEVINATGGLSVFLAPEVVQPLDSLTLDTDVDDSGRKHLVLKRAS